MADKDEKTFWVGFDLGGTKMQATIFDAEFRPLGSKRAKTKGNEGAEAGVDRIIKLINEAQVEAGVTDKALSGLGIGCPGILDLDRGIMHLAPNLGWENIKLKDILEKALKCPAYVVNDVDAGVYGEYRFGAARDAHCALGVFPGTGIGGGCIYEDRILRGKTNSCMEIGHIQVMPGGPLCGCGRHGCLEAVASRLFIAASAAMAAYRGQAPHLLADGGTDVAAIRSGALSRAIEAGDEAIERIVRQAAKHIGTAVGSVANLLAPDIVVLGGGLVEAMPKLFVEEVREAAEKQALPSMAAGMKIVAAKLGDDATVAGAAAWARRSVEGNGRK
ncbi:MAG: ROK family protein [Planctomycetia bacterium]|nr:ROK family protein [Planctomycetia bacterium]